jgi:peptide methionine sulfoxide reductase msrA/msrB
MKNTIIYLLFTVLFSFTSCAQSKQKNELTNDPNKANAIKLTDAEWKEKLTPEQYYILREKGTENPFSGEFVFTKAEGTYHCASCGEALFTDDMKFDSDCGWPSFDKEIAGGKIIQTDDNSHGMRRTEITCAKCGGHLGHIFEDGPTETGKRYCVNSVSLSFEPKQAAKNTEQLEMITLGGGCFWCIEAIFEELKGVKKVESGYSGGKTEHPTYNEVSSGKTGQAEVVQITYDPNVISLEELLEVFFTLHDPTTLNRQGADAGTQYRSAIFYHNEEQKNIAQKAIVTLNQNKVFDNPIVTEVTAYSKFYKAENYHQEYYELNKEQPYCKAVIKPKMDKLHKVFKDKLKVK